MPEWKQEIRRRLANLKLEAAREGEIVEELSQHLEDHYAESLASGAAPEDAYRAALIELSDSEILQRELRIVELQVQQESVVLGNNRRSNMIADLWQDLRYGIRTLGKAPGLTAVVVLTLAIGIGVNTAIFSIFNTYLRPLPIKDPETVVHLKYRGGDPDFSYPDYLYLRDHTQVFSDLIAHYEEGDLLEVKSEGAVVIAGEFVSDNFFSTLGGSVILGRTFTPEENRAPGGDLVVVLSHHFWQRRFAGDPNVIGQVQRLDGKPFTIVGVLAREFTGFNFEIPDIWLPLVLRGEVHNWNIPREDWIGKRSIEWLSVSGRLKPGRTIEEARAEMRLLHSQLASVQPKNDRRDGIDVVSSARLAQGKDGRGVLIAMGIVLAATGIVLLIACSNVANLMLARAAARRKEIGVRLCLGASRGRVIRQLLTESLLLAGMGGLAGLVLGRWSIELLAPLAIAQMGGQPDEMALDFSVDVRILGFTCLVSLLSGVAFGLMPALQATRIDLVAAVKEEGAGFSRRLARSRLRNGLVVAQVALCVMLLVPAGLLLRALVHILTLDPGFETRRVLVVRYNLELTGFDQPRAQLFRRQLMEHLAALPGVERVSAEERGSRANITLPGEGAGRSFGRAIYTQVAPDYFETAGIPLVRGRGITAEDAQAGAAVVVVSESTARNLWPGEDPLGKTLRLGKTLQGGGENVLFPSLLVIGVARDAQNEDRLGAIPPLFLYVPQGLDSGQYARLLVRTARDAREMKAAVRAEARALAPNLQLSLDSVEEIIAGAKYVRSARITTGLAGGLGLLALFLATIGVYGVMAFAVSQRTREIGIRMALGAQSIDVLKMVIGWGMRLVCIGAVLGLVVSLAVAQLMRSMLFGLSATDPLTFAAVTLLLAFIALLACWIPARRAAKVDPIVSLRCE
jgi:macrolide transport system ATP-binding/permease protein